MGGILPNRHDVLLKPFARADGSSSAWLLQPVWVSEAALPGARSSAKADVKKILYETGVSLVAVSILLGSFFLFLPQSNLAMHSVN